jgi:hypothetical protein
MYQAVKSPLKECGLSKSKYGINSREFIKA